jgi:hypothetical protein
MKTLAGHTDSARCVVQLAERAGGERIVWQGAAAAALAANKKFDGPPEHVLNPRPTRPPACFLFLFCVC